MELKDLGKKKEVEMYFVQFYNSIDLSWNEVRKTFSSLIEAERAVDSLASKDSLMKEFRVVTYKNGEREYSPILTRSKKE